MNTPKKIVGQIDRTDRKTRPTDVLTPRRSPRSALPLHTEAVHCQGSSWGLLSLSLTTKGSSMHIGEASRQP